MTQKWVPVFEKDGHELVVLTEDFAGKDAEEAHKIGWGGALVEGVILGMRFTTKVREVDVSNFPHRAAMLGGVPVALISGPLFDEAAPARRAEPEGTT